MSLLSLAEMAAKCAVLMDEIEEVKVESLGEAAKIVETEAKRVLGTYDYGWPQLAQATQDDRAKQGYSENEPGLRSGEMRDSIEHTIVSESEAQVGSNDDHMVYFDLGTQNQPPRPVFEPAAIRKLPEIAAATGAAVVAVMHKEGNR